MKIKSQFIFYNVGQGLFYSGRILYGNQQEFNFVYDCGNNDRSKRHLTSVVNDYLDYLNNKNINMLIISHFHADHINGLDYLLKKKKPKYVFLPYMQDVERLYVLAKNISFAIGNEWYLNFLQNPSIFLQENGVENVYYIHPSDHNKENNEEDIEKGDNFELYNRLTEISVDIDKNNGKEKHFSDEGYVKVGYWIFKFFNLKKDLLKFKKCINNKLKLSNFDITNSSHLEILKKCYNEIKGNYNDTSLVILHKPLVKMNKCKVSTNILPYMNCSCFFYYICADLLIDRQSFAQILTGDISLKTARNYKEFRLHFSKYLKEVGFLQIPHHGAKGSWNERLFHDLPNCYYWIASAGRDSSYNHPSFKIFLDVIEKDKCFIAVNESVRLKFIIEVNY